MLTKCGNKMFNPTRDQNTKWIFRNKFYRIAYRISPKPCITANNQCIIFTQLNTFNI